MQRHELIEAMQALGLKGMAGAFDEIFSVAVKRQRAPEAILAELLKAEQTERQMRSIRYRISAVKLPEAKDLAGFEFEETPINAPLVRSLHEGGFLAEKRNIVPTACRKSVKRFSVCKRSNFLRCISIYLI